MKKGFTLIELLAVIVILAIIALIATPIVLSIIEETKESAVLRSAEHYLSSVEQSIMKKNLTAGGSFSPDICEIQESGNLLCDGTETLEIEVSGEVPSSGNIIIKKGKIYYSTLNYQNDKVVKNYDGKVAKVLDKMCELVSDADNSKTITAGDKYSCEVKEGTSFNFYVLNTPIDENINLIMERNICEDGTVATADNRCLSAWLNQRDYELAGGSNWGEWVNNSYYGPITAMNYTYKATKAWYNVANMIVDYDDGNYGGVKTTGILTQINNYNNASVTVLETEEGYTNLKARLPLYAELRTVGYEEAESFPTYLMDYLDTDSEKYSSLNHIAGISGYWSLAGDGNFAWYVEYSGRLTSYDISNVSYGVRPVITITKSNIK